MSHHRMYLPVLAGSAFILLAVALLTTAGTSKRTQAQAPGTPAASVTPGAGLPAAAATIVAPTAPPRPAPTVLPARMPTPGISPEQRSLQRTPRYSGPAPLPHVAPVPPPGPTPASPDITAKPTLPTDHLANTQSSGCVGTTPANMTIDLNPSWDFLTNQVTIYPAAGCYAVTYRYWVQWVAGQPYTIFANPRSESFAYLDTSTHDGSFMLAGNACDANGCSNYFYLAFSTQMHAVSGCGMNGCYIDQNDIGSQNTAAFNSDGAVWTSAYIYYDGGNTTSNATHRQDCFNIGGSNIYSYTSGYTSPANYSTGLGFAQSGFGFSCNSLSPEVFVAINTGNTIQCYAHGNVTAHSIPGGAASLKSCNFPLDQLNVPNSDVTISQGGVYNFDIHTVANQDGTYTVFLGIGCPVCRALASTTIGGVGLTNNLVSTEITAATNMGGLMNLGMFVNSWFQQLLYSTNGSAWTEVSGGASAVSVQGAGGRVTFGVGNDLYCDRPDGSWRGYGGHASALLDSMNVRNRCD